MQHTTPITPYAVSVPEFARSLSVSRTLIFQLIAEGKIRSVKIGKRRLIPLSEAQRLLADAA